jgi:hypothetical protein
MKISDLINELQRIKKQNGDLRVKMNTGYWVMPPKIRVDKENKAVIIEEYF